jgi:hypothetical protein
VLTLRTRDFVSAARAAGASRRRLVRKHLIPNALSVIIVNVTFQVADAITALAFLGFLGFGLPYPKADWGDQLSSGVGFLQDGYWWLNYPSAPASCWSSSPATSSATPCATHSTSDCAADSRGGASLSGRAGPGPPAPGPVRLAAASEVPPPRPHWAAVARRR